MVFTAKCTVFCLAVLVLALATPGRAPNSEGDAHHPWPASAPSEASFDRLMAEAMERMGKDMELSLSAKERMKADISKTYNCPVHLNVTSHNPGKCPKCGRKMNLSPKEQMKAEVMKIYTCPMHPEVALDKDGNCPKCGKPLIERKN